MTARYTASLMCPSRTFYVNLFMPLEVEPSLKPHKVIGLAQGSQTKWTGETCLGLPLVGSVCSLYLELWMSSGTTGSGGGGEMVNIKLLITSLFHSSAQKGELCLHTTPMKWTSIRIVGWVEHIEWLYSQDWRIYPLPSLIPGLCFLSYLHDVAHSINKWMQLLCCIYH